MLQPDTSRVAGENKATMPGNISIDPDQGTEKFRKWSRLRWPREARHKLMRDYGCIFWDEERLEGTGLWGRDFLDISYSFETNGDIALSAPYFKEAQRSWKIRSDLSTSTEGHLRVPGRGGREGKGGS